MKTHKIRGYKKTHKNRRYRKTRKIQGGLLGSETKKQIEWMKDFFESMKKKNIDDPQIQDILEEFDKLKESESNYSTKTSVHFFAKLSTKLTSFKVTSNIELLRNKYLELLLGLINITLVEPKDDKNIKSSDSYEVFGRDDLVELKKIIVGILDFNNNKNDYAKFKKKMSQVNDRSFIENSITGKFTVITEDPTVVIEAPVVIKKKPKFIEIALPIDDAYLKFIRDKWIQEKNSLLRIDDSYQREKKLQQFEIETPFPKSIDDLKTKMSKHPNSIYHLTEDDLYKFNQSKKYTIMRNTQEKMIEENAVKKEEEAAKKKVEEKNQEKINKLYKPIDKINSLISSKDLILIGVKMEVEKANNVNEAYKDGRGIFILTPEEKEVFIKARTDEINTLEEEKKSLNIVKEKMEKKLKKEQDLQKEEKLKKEQYLQKEGLKEEGLLEEGLPEEGLPEEGLPEEGLQVTPYISSQGGKKRKTHKKRRTKKHKRKTKK